MNQELLWEEFNQLPSEAQNALTDFLAFLKERYGSRSDAPKPIDLNQPFVGMWADREDMEDSTAWVRHLRETEWGVKDDE